MEEARKIVFINQSSGYLMVDIVNAHARSISKGDFALFAGFLNPRSEPLDSSVRVERLITYNRGGNVKRFVSWFIAFLKSLYLITIRYRKHELFLVSNPPLNFFLPFFSNNKYRLLVYDIYPDAFTEFNFFKEDSIINKFWVAANKRVYQHASAVYTLTPGMKEKLGRYCQPDKVKVIPVWADQNFIKPIPKNDNPFLIKHGLAGKFVVMYSGNMGKSHNLEFILEIAEKISNPTIQFVLIGGGDKFELVKERIANRKLQNVLLLPWQETQMIPFSMTSADLAIVSTGSQASMLAVPSKTYDFISAQVPVLGLADNHSELNRLIKECQIGECFMDNQLLDCKLFIEELAVNTYLQDKIRNNLILAAKNFGPENAEKFID